MKKYTNPETGQIVIIRGDNVTEGGEARVPDSIIIALYEGNIPTGWEATP